MSTQILGIVNKSTNSSQSNSVIISKDFLKIWGQKTNTNDQDEKLSSEVTHDVMVHEVSALAVLICSVQ